MSILTAFEIIENVEKIYIKDESTDHSFIFVVRNICFKELFLFLMISLIFIMPDLKMKCKVAISNYILDNDAIILTKIYSLKLAYN